MTDEAYLIKSCYKEISAATGTMVVIIFNLQQCSPNTYLLDTFVAFYIPQMLMFNLTNSDCNCSQAYYYMWCELYAGREPNKVFNLPTTVKYVIMCLAKIKTGTWQKCAY